MLEDCLWVPGSPCHCVFCSGQFMAVQPWPWALLWGWNSLQLPPHRAGVTQGLSPRLLCKSQHWRMPRQSRQMFWRSCSLTSALSSPIQLKVARAVSSSRGDLPKCGPSGRANTTTSRAATSTRTRSPARPRCSRWGVFSEPRVPLTALQFWVTSRGPRGSGCSRAWSTSLLLSAATGLHCS